MTDQKKPAAKSLALLVATGGTAVAAAVFLVVGIGTLLVWNGVFSAGIAVMLVIYALGLAALAGAAAKGLSFGNGGIVASSLLHVMVGVSTARGSHEWWLWLFVALAAVTLLAALRVHLDELRAA